MNGAQFSFPNSANRDFVPCVKRCHQSDPGSDINRYMHRNIDVCVSAFDRSSYIDGGRGSITAHESCGMLVALLDDLNEAINL